MNTQTLIADIYKTAAKFCNLNYDTLVNNCSQSPNYNYARQLGSYYLLTYTNAQLADIAKVLEKTEASIRYQKVVIENKLRDRIKRQRIIHFITYVKNERTKEI